MTERDGIEIIDYQTYGQLVERDTGEAPDLITLALLHRKITVLFMEHLAQGDIPVWTKLSEDGKSARIVPAVEASVLINVWSRLTSLTSEEMRRKIIDSGLYPNFE